MSPLSFVIHPVGAGHAVHVFTPSGEVIVIDAGSSADWSPLDWLAQYTRRIDRLVISHPHGDHINEIEKLRQFQIGRFWYVQGLDERAVREDNQGWCEPKLDMYFELTRRYADFSAPTVPLGSATSSSAVDMQVFYAPGTGLSNLNNHSLVACFNYGGCGVIVPGDNEAPSWRGLSEIPEFASRLAGCHMFIPSHHGRESGYCDVTFPKLLRPRLCVVSDGPVRPTNATPKYRDRTIGHPVFFPSGAVENRWCVTTRDNGLVNALVDIRPNDTHLTVKVSKG